MTAPSISVVIPIYNEADRIEHALETVVGYLDRRFPRFEVIAVDDGSRDDSAAKIKTLAAREPRLKAVSFPANHGKGFAVREGMLRAGGEVVLFTDADLSTPLDALAPALEKVAAGYPVVIASRRHPDSMILVRQPWMREKVGMAFNALVQALLHLPFEDTQCGFKAFTGSAAKRIFSLCRVNGFCFDVEVILIAQRLGYRVAEIPVRWSDAPGSKVRFAHGWEILKELWAIRRNDRRGVYEKFPGQKGRIR